MSKLKYTGSIFLRSASLSFSSLRFCSSISIFFIAKLPDGTIVQGKVDNWTDYEGDQLQITIDGTTYLVHAANTIMKT